MLIISQQGFTIVSLVSVGVEDLGDIIDLAKLEFNSKLIEVLSSEFTGNATQISYVPANGKTFYHIKSHLKPVTNTSAFANEAITNRRADVEIYSNITLLDTLNYDWEYQEFSNGINAGGNTWKYESNTSKSLIGDGIKSFKLTSTNNSGTFRVHMKGFIEDSGTEPSA